MTTFIANKAFSTFNLSQSRRLWGGGVSITAENFLFETLFTLVYRR